MAEIHKKGAFFFTICRADWSERLKRAWFWRDVTCKRCLRLKPKKEAK